jgi:YVTN family beta-propeller protein
MALFAIMLAMGLGLMARPAEAQPFAYVTNENSNTVSVIDTATNTVVATIPLPAGVTHGPDGVAVAPDGKRAYVANVGTGNISVIDTASNTVVGTPIPVGNEPDGVAVTSRRLSKDGYRNLTFLNCTRRR